MARIVSIPPASNVEMDALIAAQAGDSFAVSDNMGITGRVLWRLMGAAFEPHRNLTTMNAVAASATAMNAVIASSTAMNAVVASATAMSAVAASSTAMNAVVASSTAVTAIFNSSVARIAVYDSTVAWDALRVNVTAQTHMFNIDLAHSAGWEGGAPWTHPPSVVSTTRVVVTQFRATTEGQLAQSRNFAQTVFFDTSSATFQNIFLRMAGVQHPSAANFTDMCYIIMQ